MWRKIQKSLATVVPSLLLAVFVIVMVCYLNRWDSMTAVTLIPIWAWSIVGMLACILSWIAFRGIPAIIVFCIWLVTGIGFSEESHGLFKELIHSIDPKPAPPEEYSYRVVHVNAVESPDALRRAIDLKPDLLLVRSTPEESEVATLADEAFGVESAYFVADGLAILGRGELIATLREEHGRAIHARIRIGNEFIIDVTSIDLEPSYPSPYLWKPKVWSELTKRRVANRRLLRQSLGENQIVRPSTARIIGGGFNTPPGDDVFRPLESNSLTDAFAATGSGWGNTYPASSPALRFDQIWSSPNLVPFKTTTRRIPESNHRLVIADFEIPMREEDS